MMQVNFEYANCPTRARNGTDAQDGGQALCISNRARVSALANHSCCGCLPRYIQHQTCRPQILCKAASLFVVEVPHERDYHREAVQRTAPWYWLRSQSYGPEARFDLLLRLKLNSSMQPWLPTPPAEVQAVSPGLHGTWVVCLGTSGTLQSHRVQLRS